MQNLSKVFREVYADRFQPVHINNVTENALIRLGSESNDSEPNPIVEKEDASKVQARGKGNGHLKDVLVTMGQTQTHMTDGSVAIAAITSCTNTSNPSVMVAAGLLAKHAVERGLSVNPTVKTSLAPGSRAVIDYLEKAELIPFLEALRFHLVGFGCTTCIGNSGPLPDPVAEAVQDNDLVVAAVLSGNRNFEGRIHPQVKAAYLKMFESYGIHSLTPIRRLAPHGSGTSPSTVTSRGTARVVPLMVRSPLTRYLSSPVCSAPRAETGSVAFATRAARAPSWAAANATWDAWNHKANWMPRKIRNRRAGSTMTISVVAPLSPRRRRTATATRPPRSPCGSWPRCC